MVRVSAVFAAACMVLICASFGAVLYLLFGLPATAALVSGIAALTGVAVASITAGAWRGRLASPMQIVELSRGVADLARQVVELGRRVAAMEGKVANAVERAETATAPLTAEIGEIGVLIKQLAESVIAHEMILQNAGTVPPYGAAPAAPEPPAGAGATAPLPEPPSAAKPEPVALRPHETRPVLGVVSTIDKEELAPAVQNPGAGFKGLGIAAAAAVIREAIAANRLEFFLQPIVTLPQRKVRFYEALARLRTADGELLTAGEFVAAAEAGGLMPQIDNLMLFRCVQVARRLMSRNRDVGLFCNLSAATLVDAEVFAQFTEFMEANRAIAPALVFDLTQPAYRTLGPLESESLAAMVGLGFRFSLDHVGDLKCEPRDLADRGFRFVKVPAALLLNRHGATGADIHPADLAGLLSRFGIDLIAERIESEGAVVDLLDYEVKFGQGHLFSPPRPVRADLLQAGVVDVRVPATAEARLAPPRPEPAGSVVVPGPKSIDPRLAALQRPTAIAQIARAVVARVGR